VRVTSALQEIEVLGVRVQSGEQETALKAVEAATRVARRPVSVAYANAHTLNVATDDAVFREALNRFTFVFNDGSGLALAARLKGQVLPDNLNGSDFTPELLEVASAHGWSVYFLGGRPGVAQRAARQLARDIDGLRVVGARDGYFGPDQSAAVASEVRRSGADVLVVAMGNPVQEKWLNDHLERTGVRLGVGVGAYLDFAAGTVPRAPQWMNRLGIEWVYRLAQEPKRLWRRYIVGNPLFIARVLRETLLGPRR